MCIIAAKHANTPVHWAWLENCFANNPDGAGYAVSTGQTVRVHKGLMEWEVFRKAVAADAQVEVCPVVFHFRWATHGAVCPANTHPFPLSTSKPALRALDYTAPLTLAHNGVISGVNAHGQLSDTQQAIRTVLAPLGVATLQRRAVQALVGMLGKFALSAPLDWRVLGAGWVRDKGWMFSNTDYKLAAQRWQRDYGWTRPPTNDGPYCILCDWPIRDVGWDVDAHYGFCASCFSKFYMGEPAANTTQPPAGGLRAITPASYSWRGVRGGGTTKHSGRQEPGPASYPACY